MKLELEVQNGIPVVKQVVQKAAPPANEEVHSYIVTKAKELGIDPKVALEVWSREGKAGWQSNFVKNGKRERSYGPFQLYVDGGLGNKFQQATGLDPADPANWKAGVDFALGEAKKGGWGPWYGARAAGITGKEGIEGQPASFTSGGSSLASVNPQVTITSGPDPVPDLAALDAANPRSAPDMPGFSPISFGVTERAPIRSAKPSFGDLTGGIDFGSEIAQAAAPRAISPEVFEIAKQYGVSPEVIQKLMGA